MTVKNAIKTMLTAKSKRKGIDKDTKDIIKKLEKNGDFDDDMLTPYYLTSLASNILLMKENDYFSPKKLAIEILKNTEKKADDWFTYEQILKVVIHKDDDEYTGGLNDQEWARDIIKHCLTNLELAGADILTIAQLLEWPTDGNDKQAAYEIIKLAPTKAENMGQVCNIANTLVETYDDMVLAEKIVIEAVENKLEFYNEDRSDLDDLNDVLKDKLKNNEKLKDLIH